jgi:hypothetical protein
LQRWQGAQAATEVGERWERGSTTSATSSNSSHFDFSSNTGSTSFTLPAFFSSSLFQQVEINPEFMPEVKQDENVATKDIVKFIDCVTEF